MLTPEKSKEDERRSEFSYVRLLKEDHAILSQMFQEDLLSWLRRVGSASGDVNFSTQDVADFLEKEYFNRKLQ